MKKNSNKIFVQELLKFFSELVAYRNIHITENDPETLNHFDTVKIHNK